MGPKGKIGCNYNLYKEIHCHKIRRGVIIFLKERATTLQQEERIILSTTLEANLGYGEKEENQDHEFALFLDIFLHFNITFQYHE